MTESWKTKPRDGLSRTENLGTQPLLNYAVFNNPKVITDGWYPLLKSKSLKIAQTKSVKILNHRLALYRGVDGQVRAMDAFCPHMGADLANGRVIDNDIECYFHRWRFDPSGSKVPCGSPMQKIRTWSCEEKHGFIWVYSGDHPPYRVPSPPGLEDIPTTSLYLGTVKLFAHHHVMMAGGIDLQHFSTVHDLDIQFEYEVKSHHPQLFDWNLKGKIPSDGWRAKFGRWLLGPDFGYIARFGGGSIVSLTYGPDQRFRGHGKKLPPLYLLWGCIPLESGVSEVRIFAIAPRGLGWVGKIKANLQFVGTLLLLTVLRDDDVKAFPNMRFNTRGLVPEDGSVAHFIKLINTLAVSPWSTPVRSEKIDPI